MAAKKRKPKKPPYVFPMGAKEFKSLKRAQEWAGEKSRMGFNVGALAFDDKFVILWSAGFLR